MFAASLKGVTPLAAAAGFVVSMLFLGSVSAQQAIIENLRPIGQVCLVGEACAGSVADAGSTTTADPAAVAIAAASVVEPAATAVTKVTAAEPAAVADAFDAAATYQMSCFVCHGSGVAGAPKLDDKEAWSERMAKGLDMVMANVINGLNAMPPKGLCFDCSDDDLLALVDYMSSQ